MALLLDAEENDVTTTEGPLRPVVGLATGAVLALAVWTAVLLALILI